ncbi:MAG TPA: hypothetical protein VL463_02225 [Kofleriaceae bacterium]|nr:hypothetical protein [Kofleriaceae bacterium]
MKALLLLLIAGTAAADPSLRGTLMVAGRPHCGGAYMPDYKAPAPTPGANVKLLVRKGDKNSERKPVELVTEKDGTFSAELAKGKYCVVFEDKRKKPRKGGQYADLKCLIADWSRCDAVVDVPVTDPIEVMRPATCFGPCYHGPMPP